MNFFFHFFAMLSLFTGIGLLMTIRNHARARRERRYALAARLKPLGLSLLLLLLVFASLTQMFSE